MIDNSAETIENGTGALENADEMKHLNSTRTARPQGAWQFESNSNAKEKLFGTFHNDFNSNLREKNQYFEGTPNTLVQKLDPQTNTHTDTAQIYIR